MPIGNPDWYKSGLSENVQSSNDTHELAVRLGSEVNYDRTGKVMFKDVFTRFDALWQTSKNLVTSGPVPDNTMAEYGGSSIKTVLQINANASIVIYRYIRSWNATLASIEVGVYANAIPSDFQIMLGQYYSGIGHIAKIGLDTNGIRFYYTNNVGIKVALDTLSTAFWTNSMWGALKIDVDFSLGQYVRARLNTRVYNLSGIAMQSDSAGIPDCNYIRIECKGNAVAALSFWVDRVIITEDE